MKAFRRELLKNGIQLKTTLFQVEELRESSRRDWQTVREVVHIRGRWASWRHALSSPTHPHSIPAPFGCSQSYTLCRYQGWYLDHIMNGITSSLFWPIYRVQGWCKYKRQYIKCHVVNFSSNNKVSLLFLTFSALSIIKYIWELTLIGNWHLIFSASLIICLNSDSECTVLVLWSIIDQSIIEMFLFISNIHPFWCLARLCIWRWW